MFSRKYKVPRNDTIANADLASRHPLVKGGVVRGLAGFRVPTVSNVVQREQIDNGGRKMSIWTILFVVLLIAWLGGFTVFHVAGGLIHLLLVLAVISLILHFVLGPRAV
jgi:hypothetical protein